MIITNLSLYLHQELAIKGMKDFIGEMVGTFILTFLGCSSVAVSVLFGEYNSIFQIGLVWGIAVTLSVFLTRHICYAHLNPAVSVAMVVALLFKFILEPINKNKD